MAHVADARPRTPQAAGGAAPARHFPKGLVAVSLLAGAWLLPIIAQVLHVDWLLLIVLLIGIGSVLRAGYFLLDRLVLAGVLLTGTLIAGGLLFSLWPWGLEPVPVAGTLLTILVVIGMLTGRRPRLPLRLRGSDAVVVGAGVVSAWIMLAPVAGRSFVGRLPFMTADEDKFAHFAIFDAIHRLGGYLFLHPTKMSASIGPSTAIVYPQGSHYLYAVLDIFLRSTVNPGPVEAEYSRYFTYTLIGFGFLVAAVTWSARWVAGPAMSGWRRAFICSAVATLAAVGPLTGLVRFAFDSETIGLALLALTVAVTARPAGRPKEQVLFVASALVALFYAYNIYGALAGLGIAIAAVVYRRRLLRHWVFTAVTAAIAVPVALLPSVKALLSGFSATKQLDANGDVIPISSILLIGLALILISSMATRRGRRSGVWRTLSAQLALMAVAAVAVGLYQESTLGGTSYYFYKILTAGYVICLVGFGAAGLLLPVRARESAPREPRWRFELVPSLYATAVAVTLTFVLVAASSIVQGAKPAAAWLDSWWSGRAGVTSQVWPAIDVLGRAHVLDDGKPTMVLYSNWERGNWLVTFFAGMLNRDLSRTQPTFYPIYYLGPIMGSGDRSYERVRHADDVKLERFFNLGWRAPPPGDRLRPGPRRHAEVLCGSTPSSGYDRHLHAPAQPVLRRELTAYLPSAYLGTMLDRSVPGSGADLPPDLASWSRRRSASTISVTMSSKLCPGVQPRTRRALSGLPTKLLTSIGRRSAGSQRTYGSQSWMPTAQKAVLRNSRRVRLQPVATI
jgi:hypothetical protein